MPAPGLVVYQHTDSNAGPEGDQRGRHDVAWGWAAHVHLLGYILRDIDNLWIGRLDDHHLSAVLVLDGDRLVIIAVERPCGVGLLAQCLDGGRHRSLICLECSSDRSVIVDVLRHGVEHCGESNESNDGGVKAFALRRVDQRLALQIVVFVQPVVGIDNLLRIA
jgi:hypothetical protein